MGVIDMAKGFKKSILTISLILMILFSAVLIIDSISAEDNVPKGFETYYMRGYGFNVPSSYKLVNEGSLERHSSSFNKNVMDGFSSFKMNDEKLYKTSISGITGFYNKRNKVKTFVFASEDDMIYLHIKGPSVTNVVSSIDQRDYRPYHSNEYDFDDDAYYESDAYDDSFDDSFDDASYYNYRW